MTHYRLSILTLIAAATVFSSASADGDIVLAAKESAATVTPRPAHLKLVNLPSLEFSLRAAIHCAGTPASLTLSVADTFKTLGSTQLEGQRAAEATLMVPAMQLALAAHKHFCIEKDPESGDELIIPGFATAHASLQCSNDDRTSAHTASVPLQVRLSCQREPAAVSDEDQESSER